MNKESGMARPLQLSGTDVIDELVCGNAVKLLISPDHS